MDQPLLPETFRDLDPFAATWALETERERNHRSWVRPQEELKAFYDAMLPRLEPALEYLQRYALADMPADARRLFHMTLSLAEVTMAVEVQRNQGAARFYDHRGFVPVTFGPPRLHAAAAKAVGRGAV
ncbi:hypothetical protein WME88_21645 [Sorangium sp. So ce216]